jgi:hypothetical protein
MSKPCLLAAGLQALTWSSQAIPPVGRQQVVRRRRSRLMANRKPRGATGAVHVSLHMHMHTLPPTGGVKNWLRELSDEEGPSGSAAQGGPPYDCRCKSCLPQVIALLSFLRSAARSQGADPKAFVRRLGRRRCRQPATAGCNLFRRLAATEQLALIDHSARLH